MRVIAESSAGTGALLAALVVGLAVVLTFMVRRANRLRRFARDHGLLYQSGDPLKLGAAPLHLFSLGETRGFDSTMWGPWKGVQVAEADYWYSGSARGSGQPRLKRFSVAVVDLGAEVPFVSIRREDMVSALADHLGLHDIDFESERFNRGFEVVSRDREFAFKLVDARMMEWLLGAAGKFGFETGGTKALIFAHPKMKKPEQLAELFDVAAGFAQHVPRLVRAETAVESPAAAFARQHDMQYSPTDPTGHLAEEAAVFASGQAGLIREVLWGTWNGQAVEAAEYQYQGGSPDFGAPPTSMSVALATVPGASFPHLGIEGSLILPHMGALPPMAQRMLRMSLKHLPERLAKLKEEEARLAADPRKADKLAQVRRREEMLERQLPMLARLAGSEEVEGMDLAQAAVGIEVGSEEFRKEFLVRGEDQGFAHQLLDGGLSEWLTASGRGFGFQVAGDSVVAYHPMPANGDPTAVLDALTGFVAHVSPESG